jgi:RNA:NAD 2'-phosphotransferase (TPT1/KptA family)
VTLAKVKTAMTAIMLDLPDQTIQQAQQAAIVLQKPVEDVLSDFLSAVLPSLQDVPAAMQTELTKMTWFDNQALWQIAQSSLSAAMQDELRRLSMTQEQRTLTLAEQQRLDLLRQEYGRVTLRKARSYVLLSLRGGKPLLA